MFELRIERIEFTLFSIFSIYNYVGTTLILMWLQIRIVSLGSLSTIFLCDIF